MESARDKRRFSQARMSAFVGGSPPATPRSTSCSTVSLSSPESTRSYSKFYGTRALNRRADLDALDATLRDGSAMPVPRRSTEPGPKISLSTTCSPTGRLFPHRRGGTMAFTRAGYTPEHTPFAHGTPERRKVLPGRNEN